MLSGGFETAIPAINRPQTLALDPTTTGNSRLLKLSHDNDTRTQRLVCVEVHHIGRLLILSQFTGGSP